MLIARLDPEDLRVIVGKAAERHEDVARAVRLAASRGSGDLSQLQAEIDRGLRTSRYLGYRRAAVGRAGEPSWRRSARRSTRRPRPSWWLLIERAIGHVVKVILKADDSDGLIGDLARELLDLHARACDAGNPDPIKLARWMVRFRFDDQDFFEVDPVRYANALGDLGLAAYRREVKQRVEAGGGDSFAARYAQERLAVLDGDTEALVGLLGGDLSRPYQFIRVAEAMAELGRDDDVLSWATRGIAETSGWQVAQLYDLAAGVHTARREDQEVLRLRREQHQRMPSSSTYGLLRSAAEACGVWPAERPVARAVLAERELGGLVDVLLADGEPEAAWQVAVDNPGWDPGKRRWMQLAEAPLAVRARQTRLGSTCGLLIWSCRTRASPRTRGLCAILSREGWLRAAQADDGGTSPPALASLRDRTAAPHDHRASRQGQFHLGRARIAPDPTVPVRPEHCLFWNVGDGLKAHLAGMIMV